MVVILLNKTVVSFINVSNTLSSTEHSAAKQHSEVKGEEKSYNISDFT